MVLTIMDRDGDVDHLVGEVKLNLDNYASHFYQNLEDQLTLHKKDLNSGTLVVRVEWSPDQDQFNEVGDDLEPPMFE